MICHLSNKDINRILIAKSGDITNITFVANGVSFTVGLSMDQLVSMTDRTDNIIIDHLACKNNINSFSDYFSKQVDCRS